LNATDTEAQSPGFFRKLYLGWLEIAARFGEVQTLIVVALVYAFVIGPTAAAIAIGRGDLLHKRGLYGEGSVWNEADSTSDPDVERAKRLF
jgi:hypothetical protein